MYAKLLQKVENAKGKISFLSPPPHYSLPILGRTVKGVTRKKCDLSQFWRMWGKKPLASDRAFRHRGGFYQ